MNGFHQYRTPQSLRVSTPPANRVLLVGSCISLLLDDLMRNEYGLATELLHIHSMTNLDVNSYRDSVDFQVVAIPVDSIFPRHIHFFSDFNDESAAKARFDASCTEMLRLLDQAMQVNAAFSTTTFVCNLLCPQQNPQGRLLPRYSLLNPVFFFEELNRVLCQAIYSRPGAYLLDIDSIAATFGKAYIQDDSIWSLSHGGVLTNLDWELYENVRASGHHRVEPIPTLTEGMEARPELFWRAVCEEVIASYRTIRRMDPVKAIVVDLDDTLWRSVIAESAVEEPQLLFEGMPYGIAEALLYAKSRGIALAIASKNDFETVKAFWDRRVRWFLDFDHFVIKKIHWGRKSESIREIAFELNIGLDSVIFIDDNPRERVEVQSELPQVRVLGSDFYQLRRDILWSPECQVAAVTAESRAKTELFRAQLEREGARKGKTREEFLVSLDLELQPTTVTSSNHPLFARAVELINKTNQFNTTGIRWTPEQLSALFNVGGMVCCFAARDRYTDYGTIGVVVTEAAQVHILVMSCRVIGLDVEHAMLRAIERQVMASGQSVVRCQLVPTGRNQLAIDFMAQSGWRETEGCWCLELSSERPYPSHIKFVTT